MSAYGGEGLLEVKSTDILGLVGSSRFLRYPVYNGCAIILMVVPCPLCSCLSEWDLRWPMDNPHQNHPLFPQSTCYSLSAPCASSCYVTWLLCELKGCSEIELQDSGSSHVAWACSILKQGFGFWLETEIGQEQENCWILATRPPGTSEQWQSLGPSTV